MADRKPEDVQSPTYTKRKRGAVLLGVVGAVLKGVASFAGSTAAKAAAGKAGLALGAINMLTKNPHMRAHGRPLPRAALLARRRHVAWAMAENPGYRYWRVDARGASLDPRTAPYLGTRFVWASSRKEARAKALSGEVLWTKFWKAGAGHVLTARPARGLPPEPSEPYPNPSRARYRAMAENPHGVETSGTGPVIIRYWGAKGTWDHPAPLNEERFATGAEALARARKRANWTGQTVHVYWPSGRVRAVKPYSSNPSRARYRAMAENPHGVETSGDNYCYQAIFETKTRAKAFMRKIRGLVLNAYASGVPLRHEVSFVPDRDTDGRSLLPRINEIAKELGGGLTGNYKLNPYTRTRVASPAEFDPRSLRTVTPGSGQHKMVVGCPTGSYRGGRCLVGTEVQSVLKRVGRNTRRNPLLMVVPNPGGEWGLGSGNPDEKWHEQRRDFLREAATGTSGRQSEFLTARADEQQASVEAGRRLRHPQDWRPGRYLYRSHKEAVAEATRLRAGGAVARVGKIKGGWTLHGRSAPVKMGGNPRLPWHQARVKEYGALAAGDEAAGHGQGKKYWEGALAAEAAAVAKEENEQHLRKTLASAGVYGANPGRRKLVASAVLKFWRAQPTNIKRAMGRMSFNQLVGYVRRHAVK